MFIGWLSLILFNSALGAPELSDYRASLGHDLAKEVSDLNGSGKYRDAIKLAGRIQRGVAKLAPVSYEAGYAHYRLGELDAAVRQYDSAIRRDPTLAMAYYDRGEIFLSQGKLEGAEADFLAVIRLTPNHWAGHFRLAHLAGLAGAGDLFEEHLMDALRHGFDLDTVTADPDWQAFTRSANIRPVLRKVVVLYGSDALRDWVGEGR